MKTNYAMKVITKEFVYTYHYKSWEEAQQNFISYTECLNKLKTTDVNTIILTKDERIRMVWNKY